MDAAIGGGLMPVQIDETQAGLGEPERNGIVSSDVGGTEPGPVVRPVSFENGGLRPAVLDREAAPGAW